MPAYMIVTALIKDTEAFMTGYGPAAGALVEQFGGEYLLRGPGAECLEGDFGDGAAMVISKWENREAAKAFWNSPEYTQVKKLREGIADVQVLLIEASELSL